ncbi:ABC transporter six-transmembrane domain-containing protein [Sandaracinobacteroides saxicola]|uniref:ABC transmembrane type-1 domain-containing protein n=1 Tax=Sandaracinobacteroides saxicola TaxID=2759707 RepID=A0A7G5IIY7_9SPHN|nr:ABC transporter six-transmembrane domain-containing protein [Sandaracinobacteroides saxicola]QMW23329.1 hypothetical protein H3309_02150 [Sandaracinobacteroides saxicola]
MLSALARAHARPLSFAYALRAAAEAAGQLYPLATGVAINGVLTGHVAAVGWLVACHAAMMVLEVSAKMLDTRVFTRVYGQLATDVVRRGHDAGADPNVIVAHASLSREYVTFFEEQVPAMLYAAISIVIAVVVLVGYDRWIGAACLLLVLPLAAINLWLSRRSKRLNRGLNDRLEREVELVRGGGMVRVARHFRALAGWRVKLSDAEAKGFGLMELTVILLVAVALWRVGQGEAVLAGDVYAVFAYVWRYVHALDQVPLLVQQLAKISDLNRRMAPVAAPDGSVYRTMR